MELWKYYETWDQDLWVMEQFVPWLKENVEPEDNIETLLMEYSKDKNLYFSLDNEEEDDDEEG